MAHGRGSVQSRCQCECDLKCTDCRGREAECVAIASAGVANRDSRSDVPAHKLAELLHRVDPRAQGLGVGRDGIKVRALDNRNHLGRAHRGESLLRMAPSSLPYCPCSARIQASSFGLATPPMTGNDSRARRTPSAMSRARSSSPSVSREKMSAAQPLSSASSAARLTLSTSAGTRRRGSYFVRLAQRMPRLTCQPSGWILRVKA